MAAIDLVVAASYSIGDSQFLVQPNYRPVKAQIFMLAVKMRHFVTGFWLDIFDRLLGNHTIYGPVGWCRRKTYCDDASREV